MGTRKGGKKIKRGRAGASITYRFAGEEF